jgi:hypothetical protein
MNQVSRDIVGALVSAFGQCLASTLAVAVITCSTSEASRSSCAASTVNNSRSVAAVAACARSAHSADMVRSFLHCAIMSFKSGCSFFGCRPYAHRTSTRGERAALEDQYPLSAEGLAQMLFGAPRLGQFDLDQEFLTSPVVSTLNAAGTPSVDCPTGKSPQDIVNPFG